MCCLLFHLQSSLTSSLITTVANGTHTASSRQQLTKVALSLDIMLFDVIRYHLSYVDERRNLAVNGVTYRICEGLAVNGFKFLDAARC